MSFFNGDIKSSEFISTGTLKIGTAAGSGVDAYLYTAGAAAHVGIQWDADGETEGILIGGADANGVDFKFFGESTGKYVHWDMSGDELVLASSTKLSFHDAAGGENIVASSNGHLEVNAGTTLDITAPTIDINASTDVAFDGPNVTLNSSASGKPVLKLRSTHTTNTSSGELQFLKDALDTEDGEVLGKITFYGEDEGNNNTQFAEIQASIGESDETDESGILELKVAESDGTNTAVTTGLKLTGSKTTDGLIDVSLGAHADSLITIAGDLDIPNGGFKLGGDASGDMYYRDTNGVLTRIGVGSDNHVLTLDGAVPVWEAAAGGASTSSANTFTEEQTISKDTDGEFVALKLVNQSDAANTSGIVSLQFDLEHTGGIAVDSGKIAVKKNESFTSTVGTQDSNMVFSTSLNGEITEYLTIDSVGRLYTSSGDKTHASVGSGFNHTNSICNFYISKIGGEIITTILVDLTNLTYTTSTDSTSVIGKADTSACYFYETSLTTNGIIYNLELICLKVPTGASSPPTNIGLYYNSSSLATGAIVSNQKIIMNATQSIGTKSEISFGESIASSATKLYFYGTSGMTSTYSAGQFLVKLYGAPTL